MNKRKQKIVNVRVSLIRRLASEIGPFSVDLKYLNKWYTENTVTPLRASHNVQQMNNSKLQQIFYRIKELKTGLLYLHGNYFIIKFIMTMFVAKKKDRLSYTKSYHDFIADIH